MTQFDMNKFVNFLEGKKAKTESTSERQSLPKLRYFKVQVDERTKKGEQIVRWLPYISEQGAPAFSVWFYDNPAIFGERRAVAPFQFGMEDPIAEYVEERRRQGRLKEDEYKQVMKLTPRQSWFIPLLVRGKEDDGAYLWELNDKRFKKLALSTIANPEYRDEPIIDPASGKDLLILSRVGDKVFNGKRTTEWTATVRAKSSKVAKSDEDFERTMDSIQDPVAYNKQFVRKTDFYQGILTNALAFFQNGGSHEGADGNGISRGSAPARQNDGTRDAVENALDAAFDDDTF